MGPILATTDFSERSGWALARAARIAAAAGAPLALLHVVEDYQLQMLQRLGEEHAGQARWLAEARAELERRAAGLRRDGLPVESSVRVGRVYQEIAGEAEARGAALTVLGAHGEHFLRDLFLGATAQKVVRRNARSTLVVKRPGDGPYRRVVAAVDFSPGSRRAVETALAIAPDAEVELLHAFELPYEGKLRFAGVEPAAVQGYLRAAQLEAEHELAAFIAGAGIEPGCVAARVVHGYAPEAIVRAAGERAADLVAVGAHGHSELAQLMLGSVSLHVVMEAPCDVLVAKLPGQ